MSYNNIMGVIVYYSHSERAYFTPFNDVYIILIILKVMICYRFVHFSSTQLLSIFMK